MPSYKTKTQVMLNAKDIETIKARGADEATVTEQLENFRKGFPFLKLINSATTGNGIKELTDKEIDELTEHYDNSLNEGLEAMKFVPASGAATRMFKSLFEAKDEQDKGVTGTEPFSDDVRQFCSEIKKFAFYSDLKNTTEKTYGLDLNNFTELEHFDSKGLKKILNCLLTEEGLNYGNLPKALIKFHKYGERARTPFMEHAVEGALYTKKRDGRVKIHFTVSPEHMEAFKKHLGEIKETYEDIFGVSYEISFSRQKSSTDTIAVTPDNEPFRNDDGSLLFRPGGHGALLANLNDLDADLVFIKNIDNIVPDHLKPVTIKYKKALAGLLLKLQQRIFSYQQIFDTHHYYALDSVFLSEATGFLENILNVKPPESQYYTEKEDLYYYLKSKFDRPVRVCGMVRNQGEPGGGPFLAKNSDGSVSLQIVESSQVDLGNPVQKEILNESTHFNPVDLVCAFKNYKGEKYDLFKFRDRQTGFISNKSKDGKTLKAQELPGLWNGAMADWNTVFVEVPVDTFNPVKTVNDLLRKEHQI